MAGSYGWNIDDIESSEGDSEIVKMPMPYDEDNSSAPKLDFSHPHIKGCFSCCCTEDEDDNGQMQYPPEDDKNPRGFFWCEYNGSLPDTAVKAGVDKDGSNLYIGRAIHEGEMQPAKVLLDAECAYVPYGGLEISKSEFEILCRGNCNVIWQECRDGSVPAEAVSAGVTADGEKLYVGRVFHDGCRIPGKIHPSHGCCYIPYEGEELSFNEYEVLVLQ